MDSERYCGWASEILHDHGINHLSTDDSDFAGPFCRIFSGNHCKPLRWMDSNSFWEPFLAFVSPNTQEAFRRHDAPAEDTIFFDAVLRDFKADHPDFESLGAREDGKAKMVRFPNNVMILPNGG